MRWNRGHVSRDVEDRRGKSALGGRAKLGGIGLVIALVAVVLGRPDIAAMFMGGSSGSSGASSSAPPTEQENQLYEFISFALDDQQDTWTRLYEESGQSYQRAKLVVFSDAVDSACGTQSSAVGPFYCAADESAYIDLRFYKELARLGGPGDFAQAYVLAHEIGHHVQHLSGTSAAVRRKQAQNKREANALSVALELQADCYAGVWAHYASKRDLLEMGDLEEGLAAAAAIGDDTLQRRATGTTAPESWTHGSSAERVRWFKVGYQAGRMDACDTF